MDNIVEIIKWQAVSGWIDGIFEQRFKDCYIYSVCIDGIPVLQFSDCEEARITARKIANRIGGGEKPYLERWSVNWKPPKC